MSYLLSDAEKVFIGHGVESNFRADGRSNDAFRPVVIETGLIASAAGSARFKACNTDVMVVVKAEVNEPAINTPKLGAIHFAVDFSASAIPEYENRGGVQLAEDVTNALSAAYANSQVLDFSKLCIIPGKACWLLYVDILVLEFGGNLYDIVAMAVTAALYNARIPNVTIDRTKDVVDFRVTDDQFDCFRLNTERCPSLVTVGRINGNSIIDLSADEEQCSPTSLVIGVSGDSLDSCIITHIKQIGKGSLEQESVTEMVELGVVLGCKINQMLKKRLKDEENLDAEPSGFLV